MKKKFGLLQFIIVPTISTVTIVVGVYMNTQLAFMLAQKDMFGID